MTSEAGILQGYQRSVQTMDKAFQQILMRAVLDSGFREALFENPERFWETHAFPACDLPKFKAIDRSAFEAFCSFLHSQVLDERSSFENIPLIIAFDESP